MQAAKILLIKKQGKQGQTSGKHKRKRMRSVMSGSKKEQKT